MPGGDQNRFMKAIDGTGLDEVIRARYRAGAMVGGTSAGAAVHRRGDDSPATPTSSRSPRGEP